MINKHFSSAKLRCGIWASVLSLVVIVCVGLIIYLADLAEKKWALQADLSFSSITNEGAVTDRILKELTKDVEIWLISSSSTEYDLNLSESDNLEVLLQRYASLSPHLSFTRTSLVKNPLLATRFQDALGEKNVSTDCMIVHCSETGRARILDSSDYYVYSFDNDFGYYISGYRYEKSITEAILYVTQDELPVLQFLTGHGEFTVSDLTNMTDRLISANYMIHPVNILTGDTLDSSSPLFIISPQYDLSESELRILMDFADQGGSFFICCEFSDPIDLPRFNSLLSAYGVTPLPGLAIADKSVPGSYYDDNPFYLMPYLQKNETTSSLLAASETLYVLAGARAFTCTDSIDGMISVLPVLVTDKAYIRDYEDISDDFSMQPDDIRGNLVLSAAAVRISPTGERSRAYISGNITMFSEVFMQNNTSSVPLMLQMTQYLQNKAPVDLNILPHSAERENMTLRSLTIPMIVIGLLPLLVLFTALIVLLPRKNR